MTDTVIEAEGLRRGCAGGFEAVRGVSFSVARGEIFALLGTSGAGKTSTVELPAGLAAPSGGQVRVFGLDPYERRAEVRPRTGVMLQEGGFPSDLSVAETTGSVTRTVETAGLTTLPLFLAIVLGSGLFVPADALPDPVAPLCELLPLSGVMTLVRAGWSGAGDADLVPASLVTLAWTVITVFAVQRWFRWEPRR